MEYGKKLKSFTDLYAWQEGHKLVLKIYKLTKNFPKEELFGLISQMRRCVISITSNLAEGFNRQSIKEKIHFYSIAQGSLSELQSQLIVGRDLGYVSRQEFDKLAEQAVIVHKLITGLIKGLKSRAS